MDYLIQIKCTGNARNFSSKLGISVSQLKEDISEMRSLGALIEFDRRKNSYVYKDSCKLVLKFLNDKSNRPVI